MATLFHLIRHAEYGLTGQVLGGRAPGHGLTQAGLAQAHALAGLIEGRRVGAVVSSPMERAQETALPIAACLSLDLQIDPAFNELDFGEWTGLPFDVLADQPAWQAWNQRRGWTAPPNGESQMAAQTRALAGLLSLRDTYPDHEVVIVSHSDIVKSLLAYALGLPLDMMHRLEISPGSRSLLMMYDDAIRVDEVNRLPP